MNNRLALRIQSLKYLDYQVVDLEIAPGEVVSVTGKSGSGKSLLLKAIIDLIPSSGEIFLGSTCRSQIQANIWRKRVVYLPTENYWWGESLEEHFLDLDHKILHRLGFTTEIFKKPVHFLSTGEKQRLAFLRVIQRAPDILLLDEPTSSLDPENTKLIEEQIIRLSNIEGIPIILISHDPDQRLRLATQQYTLINKSVIKSETGGSAC